MKSHVRNAEGCGKKDGKTVGGVRMEGFALCDIFIE